jgi:glucosamine-6-phosphate deaminase
MTAVSAGGRSLDVAGAEIRVFPTAAEAGCEAGARIARAVAEARAARGRAVLGLATGGTPIRAYAELVRLHQGGELSFRDVRTYNLDEYYPMSGFDPQSYRFYMNQHLFSKVDLAPNAAHVLDGTVPDAATADHCAEFDRWIAVDGGLDLQLLGIGRNGHIGFNEPSDLPVEAFAALPTRRVALHPVTAADAARDFGGDLAKVPAEALTMGVRPILAARSILILAFGDAKADAVAKALTGPISAAMPASLLRTTSAKVTWLLDEAAASGLGGRRESLDPKTQGAGRE